MKKLIFVILIIWGFLCLIAANHLTTRNPNRANQGTADFALSPETMASLAAKGFTVSETDLPVRSPRMLDSTNLPETVYLQMRLDVRQAKNLQITWLGAPATRTRAGNQSEVILSEGFESDFPGANWRCSGNPTWGKSTHQKHGGQNSVFCAKDSSSGVTPPTNYPNNMNAMMVLGPFDLSDASLAFVRFWYWLESEINKDWFWYMASMDGVNFKGIGVSGSTGTSSPAWEQTSLNLADVPDLGSLIGKSSVWIAFGFSSDSTGAKRGAFVDDVEVQKAPIGTGISGYLKGILSPAGNPYIVLENIGIKSSDSLLIEPGVIVKFTKGKEFIIEGYLNAIGTVTDSIIFTSENINPQPGDWAGLGFYSNSNRRSKVQYCRIEYGGHSTPFLVSVFGSGVNYGSNIFCQDNSLTISNNLIAKSSYNGIFFLGSSPRIVANVIKANKWFGIRGRAGLYYEFGWPLIESNIISENQEGIYIFLCNPTVVRNTISYNKASGINCDTSSPLLRQNIISNNSGDGILMGGSTLMLDHEVRIFENQLLDNNGTGIKLGGLSYSAKIFNNLIKGNKQSGIDFAQQTSSFDIDIVNNTIINSNGIGINCGEKKGSTRTKIINNILADNNKSGIFFRGVDPYTIRFNDFFNNHPNFDFSYPDSLGNFSKTNAKGDSCDKFFNIFKDALFVDESMNDYHLRKESPCLDAGNPNALYNDSDSTFNDMGCFGGGLLHTNLTEYHFGGVIPGSTGTVDWRIENYREQSVIINSFQFSDPINFGLSQTSSLTIPPNESKSIKITYKPQTALHHESNMIMNGNHFYAFGSPSIKLRGDGIGGTRVSGAVSGIWRKSGNPYIIYGNTKIESGKKLQIEPGVEIRFDGRYAFYVSGKLEAIGTPGDSIIITRHNSNGGSFIFTSTTDTSKFMYCKIEKMDGYYTDIETRLFAVIGTYYQRYSSIIYSPFIISNCHILNNQTKAIFVKHGTAIIKHSKISNNNSEGIFLYEANAEISDCIIMNNQDVGLYCSSSNVIIKNNLILKNNGQSIGGVLFSNSSAIVINNVFSGNFGLQGGGISSYEGSLTLINNLLYDNSCHSGIGGLDQEKGTAIVLNNIFWKNRNRLNFSQIGILNSNSSYPA